MNKKQIRIFYTVLLGLTAIVLLTLYIRSVRVFHFEDHLNETVFTVDGTDISLQECSFYIYNIEKKVDAMANQYNPEDETQFWNVHFSAGENSTFVRTMAKDAAYETCVYDFIMEKEAQEAGVELTQDEKNKVAQEAASTYQKMAEKTRTVTGLDQDKLEELMLRRALSKKYAYYLVDHADFSLYTKTPQEELNYDGDYYTKMIKGKYVITVNTKLWDEVTIGNLTQ